ncbi:MAG: OadG family protein [Desulfotignum sp.]|nr:OadG family protein [Desulfotignum sp.]
MEKSLVRPDFLVRKILTRKYCIYRLYFKGYLRYVIGWNNIESRPENIFGDQLSMIIQGLKLTLLGMGVVFSFLVLLFVLIVVFAKLLAPFTKKELSMAGARKPARNKPRQAPDQHLKLTAIISAAIFAHRARSGRH